MSEGRRTFDWRSAIIWTLAVVALVTLRQSLGERILLSGPTGPAVFEVVLASMGIIFAVVALGKFSLQSDISFLRLAVGTAAFGLIHLYSVLVGLGSPAGYLANPTETAVHTLGAAATLSLVIGVVLALVRGVTPRKSAILAPAGVAGLVIGAVLLSQAPTSAAGGIRLLLHVATWSATLVALAGIASGRSWRMGPIRPWLGIALCVIVALEIRLPGAPSELSHGAVSLADVYVMAAIILFMEGGIAELFMGFRLQAITNRDLIEVNRQLVKSGEDLQKAERVRATFLGTVSHELRTPLNAVSGFSQLLARDRNLSARQQRQLANIKEGADRLTELVDDILSLTRADSWTDLVGSAKVDARAMLEPFLQSAAAAASAKHLQFDAEIEPASLPGHQALLGPALAKVMDNAIKFSTEGRIVVRGTTSGERYVVTVADQGPGIQLHLMEHLFESFSQGEEGPRRSFGGLGLGLSIAQRLVTAMHGTISVTSNPGKGSTFVIEVPFRDDGLGDQPVASSPKRPPTVAAGSS